MLRFFSKIIILITIIAGPVAWGQDRYQAKDFSSLQVKGLNQDLISMHITLYKGYVKNTNELLQMLEDMRTKGREDSLTFGALKRRLGWEYDGMRLHELYFESLIRPVPISNKNRLYQEIASNFGSFEAWKKDFMAMGTIRGVGWVILYRDPIENKLINVWVNEHDLGHLAGGKPLIVMDVWEHAYITQYGLNRAQYIKAFMDALNWDILEKRCLAN